MINTLIKLALAETILKPVLIHITRLILKDYLKPLYNTLDNYLECTPLWDSFIGNPIEFVYSIVMTENEKSSVDPLLLSKLVIDQFNLKTFLEKSNGQRQ